MAEFRIPGKILYGDHAAQGLSTIKGQRLLLVYDDPAGMAAALEHLVPSKIHTRLFQANPDHADIPHIAEGTKALMEFKPQWVLAVGGHSAMDTAKLIRIFYQQPNLAPEDIIQGRAAGIILDKTRLITLPLYDTHGSEVTCSARFMDAAGDMAHSVSIPSLMADIAIIDPALISSPDAEREAQCILSAFVLAIEAASQDGCSSFSRPIALEAIRLLAGGVPVHSALPYRPAHLLYAQCLAGMAHGNSPSGLCSTICLACSTAFGSAPFGSLGAIFLPEIIRREDCTEKHLASAQAMGLTDARSLADAVQEYADMLGLPLSLNELGISKNAFLKKLSKLSHRVVSLLPSPPDGEKEAQKQVEQILRSVYTQNVTS